MVWTPDSALFAVRAPAAVALHSAHAARPVARFPARAPVAHDAARYVLAVAERHALALHNYSSGRRVCALRPPADGCAFVDVRLARDARSALVVVASAAAPGAADQGDLISPSDLADGDRINSQAGDRKVNRTYTLYSLDVQTHAFTKVHAFPEFTCWAVSSSGQHVVIAGYRAFEIINMENQLSVRVDHDARITSVALHPTKDALAIGDETGRIALRHFMLSSNGRPLLLPVAETLHWHAHRAAAVAFSPDGSYLYSGGDEAVLVVWQLDTGSREYLPRIGAAISQIACSPDGRWVAVHTRDSSVRVVSTASMDIAAEVRGIAYTAVADRAQHPFRVLVRDPRSGHTVMNGCAGALQFYDHARGEHVLDVDISPRNRVTALDDSDAAIAPHVTHCEFSSDGAWMVTAETHAGGIDNDEHETALKFWQYDAERKIYVLNTRIEAPHTEIVSVKVRPNSGGQDSSNQLVVASCGRDKKVKLWGLTTATTYTSGKTAELETYTHFALAATTTFRDLAPTAAQFAPDGSMLCVAYGAFLAFCDPASGALIASHLTSYRAAVTQLEFLGEQLVYATRDCVAMFDLCAFATAWRLHVAARRVLVSAGQHLHVLAKLVGADGQVAETVFLAVSKAGKVTGKTTVKKKNAKVLGALAADGRIWYMTNRCELKHVDVKSAGSGGSKDAAASATKRDKEIGLAKMNTLFSDIFGAQLGSSKGKKKHDSSTEDVQGAKDGKAVPGEYLDGASHALPSVRVWFDEYMDFLLLADKSGGAESHEMNVDGEQEESDRDEDALMEAAREEDSRAGEHAEAESGARRRPLDYAALSSMFDKVEIGA